MGQPNDDVEELAAFYRFLADAEFDGYCDLYARLARAIADDRELLDRIVVMAPATKVLPILLFAAVHFVVLGEPGSDLAACYRGDDGAPADPWPLFAQLVDERHDELAELVATRTIQTNEVGRSSILLPTFNAVHRHFDRPLALVEVGPSAGLNLFFDRFAYTYDDGVELGDPSSTVRLDCAVRGGAAPPRHGSPPPVQSRVGVDLAPVDVTDDDACPWLEACVWPRQTERSERLRAAIALARAEPPDLRRGNALDQLPALVAATDPGSVTCIYATWVLAYFSHDEREALGRLLSELGAERDLAIVTSEYPSVAPGIDRPDRLAAVDEPTAASLVGLATWRGGERVAGPVAWCHAHGRWIDWLDPTTADSPAS
jgi:hypothetical protein